MDNQQGQPPQWPSQSGPPPNWYLQNQGWGSAQQSPQQRQPQPNTPYPQQSYQPPPQYYQQQPYYQQPPMPPPKKKSRAWLWIVLGVAGVLLCSCIGFAAVSASQQKATSTITAPADTQNATTGATQAPTQVPTHPTTWTTTHTFQGNGTKKTAIFTVGDDWKILYACTFQNIDGVTADGVFTVSVYGADNSVIDPGAVDVTCKKGVQTTSGETEEHQGGQVYLDIGGTGDWTVQVQELK